MPGDLPCPACEYNLIHLPAEGRCPECGGELAAALAGKSLHHADEGYFAIVRTGVRLFVGCAATLAGLAVLMFGHAWYGVEPGEPFIGLIGVSTTAMAWVLAVAAWKVTSRPNRPVTAMPTALRLVFRAEGLLLGVTVTAAWLILLVMSESAFSIDNQAVIMTLAAIMGSSAFFTAMYTPLLAVVLAQIARPPSMVQARWVMRGLAAVGFMAVAGWFAPAVTMWTLELMRWHDQWPMPPWLAAMLIVAGFSTLASLLAPHVVAIAALWWLGRLRRVPRAQVYREPDGTLRCRPTRP